MDVREIFEWIRREAPAAVWSRGVACHRSSLVQREASGDDEELVFQVAPKAALLTRTVHLFFEDEDFLCNCSPREVICEHIVAAALALKEAAEGGGEVGQAPALARIGYRLVRAGGGLRLLRRLVLGSGEDQPLRSTVAAAAVATGDERAVTVPLDVEIEQILGYRSPKWLPAATLARLLPKLRRVDGLTLDAEPIQIETRAVGFVVQVTNHQDGFKLALAPDPAISELLNDGVAICRGGAAEGLAVLRPIAEPELSARELRDYREGRIFRGGAQVARLVSEVLPELKARLPVEIDARGLPKTVSERPRPLLDVYRDGHELVVLASVVYGDPPFARADGSVLVTLPGSTRVPVRDRQEEERLRRKMAHHLDLKVGHRVRLPGEAAIALANRLQRWSGEVRGEGLDGFYVASPLVPRLTLDEDDFSLDFETELPLEDGAGAGRASAGAVMSAWQSGASLVPLVDGGWAPLPGDWLRRYGETISDLLAAKAQQETLGQGAAGQGTLPTSALPDLGRLCIALDAPVPPGFETLRELVDGFERLEPATLPADLTASLRHYQEAGVAWLAFLRRAGLGGLLADDMGLGKTLQALCVLTGRSLVVAPTSVLHNWAAEAKRFRPGLSVSVFHGPKRRLDPDADLVLTTYAILRLDIERLLEERWDTVVLDEAQAIKNPDSQVSRAAFRLRAGFRLTLTGTPVENRLEELWSQLQFTNPGLLGGRSDFQERYAKPILAGEPGRAARLRQRIAPFVLRRKKAVVAPELPKRTDLVLRCTLTPEERDVYDAIRATTRKEVVQRLQQGGSVFHALEALLRLRQAACHTGLIPGREAERSAKVDVLMATLTTAAAEGHKSLVFSQWTSLLDRVEPHLRTNGLNFLRLDGSTRDRGAVVEGFQAESGPPVLLLSLKAGGTGLNLTRADHVFLLDPWWNPAVEEQAADRAHRIGQDRPVFVHRLVTEDTVEERILALQARKRSLAEAALGEADRAAALTRDDLLMLLEG